MTSVRRRPPSSPSFTGDLLLVNHSAGSLSSQAYMKRWNRQNEQLREQLPVVALGIDPDNEGAFINDTLVPYCQEQAITFTPSRPNHSNDQAWIEQKNGAVIRRRVGHERFSGTVAGSALAQLLQVVRQYVNYFQPSFKLRERV